ncbi:MAG: TetR/AcrR family transcriptional regulator [Microthrixaceae bacterium]|nr:TetR/AcrR family transcriptional regulator [Microthrixaceae bacterium]
MAKPGKRERNRLARHSQLITAAGTIVSEEGIDGLTMQEVAQRVGCAVGTIYTYFPSKSALLAALQADAVRVLQQSYDRAASRWDEALDDMGTDEADAALARMVAMGRLFVQWQSLQPREFEFLQMLSVAPGRVLEPGDVAAVLPSVLALFAEARVLHDEAAEVGAIRCDLDRPGDDGYSRTVRWIAALDGAILVERATSNVAEGLDPEAFNQTLMTERITSDLLRGWGADDEAVDRAFRTSDAMFERGLLFPEVIG